MSFSAWQLLAITASYLTVIFTLAYLSEKAWFPMGWIRSSLVYVLSLGVYASAWSYYGAVGLSYQFGYGYLAFYLGICGAFLLAPVLLLPILRVTKSYQLSSIADLLAFRYRSQTAGTLSTLYIGVVTLVLMAIQFQVVLDSLQAMSGAPVSHTVGIGFCLLMVFGTIFFGARGQARTDRHPSLMLCIALEGLLKLIIFLVLGAIVVYQVFGGVGGMSEWLALNKLSTEALTPSLDDGAWRALLLLFFASALVMPHMFHMTFTENHNQQALYKASWGLPLYLLLMSLPVPVFMWAGIKLDIQSDPNFFVLAVGHALEMPWLSLLAYLGGITAASGLLIVCCVALASMMLNHLVLPLYQPLAKGDIYNWLTWVKRLLIVLIFGAGYGVSTWLSGRLTFSELGILAFSAGLQLLPGVLAVIYWPEGNRLGFICGLLAGVSVWIVSIALPLALPLGELDFIRVASYQIDYAHWHYYVMGSLSINLVVFVVVSLLTEASPTEIRSAQACSVDNLMRPSRRELVANSSEEFKVLLAVSLGKKAADREVKQAIAQLGLNEVEYRPYALRRLRDQVEFNLSGLLGPAIAQELVRRHLQFKPSAGNVPAQDINFVEDRLEDQAVRLHGLAGELDTLRRYHRQTLQNLPIASCSLGADLELLMWNKAMEQLTGIVSARVIGSHVSSIDAPWGKLLFDFTTAGDNHMARKRVDLEGRPHWYNFHKAAIANEAAGQVVMVEDYTETQMLEDELVHSERLASVGRLAAGVAHEIGNPVTGIACLAQNMKLMTDNGEVLETANHIIDQTQRISRILQTLMNFSRSGNYSQATRHEPVCLSHCIAEAIHLLSLSGSDNQVSFLNEITSDFMVTGDGQRLVQVFVNLLSNAQDASVQFGRIWIRASKKDYTTRITIEDEGPGISKDQLDQLFEPFYTTKGPDKGTGLGLALVYGIIEEHYGQIKFESPANKVAKKGTRVIIVLPNAGDKSAVNTNR